MDTTRNWATGLGVILAIAVVVALGLAIGDRVRSTSYLFVDNASDLPAVVKVDGEAAATVAPRTVGVVYTRHGEKSIRIERGGEKVFEKQLTLESPGFYSIRKYIVNPKQESGYWINTVRYERFNIPNFNFQMPGTETDARVVYRQMAGRVALLGNEEWIPVPAANSDYVLNEVPPKSIELKEGESTVTKQQICRMNRDDFDIIRAAPQKEAVTEEDLDRMEEALKRLDAAVVKPD